jgi:hypothetical protein
MPAFTAIAAAVVGWLGGAAVLGTVGAAIVGGIVATGAAMLTSRLINGSPNTGGAAANAQGTRVQLSPSPENKVPVLYGRAFCSGMVVDAYLDNQNKTMTYVMVIAETTNNTSSSYTVNNIYWNDLRLTFDGSDPSKAVSGKKNVDAADRTVEDYTNTDFAIDGGRVFINIYAGNTTSARQIFGKTQNAYSIQYLSNHWTSSYKMEGLIFAVIQVNYNSEKGFTGLPNMTFDITNSISRPSDVLIDYLTSDRYGANIPVEDIDAAAMTAFGTYSDEDVTYTDLSETTVKITSTQSC